MTTRNAPYVWEIAASPYPSAVLSETKQFGVENPCYLVDQYSGRRPALINEEFLVSGTFQFRLFASALLDSNLASQVHAIASGGKVHDGFRELLVHLTKFGWDFSLHFYYVEHFCKAQTRTDFMRNAEARTRALLKLHFMDKSKFLATGDICPDSEAVDHHLQTSCFSSLDEAAYKRVHHFTEVHDKSSTLDRLEAIEVALVKMILLRRFELPKASPLEQYDAFLRFLEHDLNAMLAREAHLALHYFYDRAGSLLGIQPNTPFLRAVSTVKRTAWDMYFLRFPEQFFSGTPTEMCLSYIATQEKQLAALARLFYVESITGSPSGCFLPAIGYELSELPEEASTAATLTRPPPTARKSVPVGLKSALINELKRLLPA